MIKFVKIMIKFVILNHNFNILKIMIDKKCVLEYNFYNNITLEYPFYLYSGTNLAKINWLKG